jgi:hypothetical protein
VHPRVFVLLALALIGGSACSSGSGQADREKLRTQRLEVQYRGEDGSDHTTVIRVSVRKAVAPAPPQRQGQLSDAGCEGQDGRTLNLVGASVSVQVGPSCGWSDRLGPVSPDGRYLAVWQPADGAAADLHLVDLGAAPADLGPVPKARSADYIATWTMDNRLWYTSDEGPTAPPGRLWSFAPGGDKADSTVVVQKRALVRAVGTQP